MSTSDYDSIRKDWQSKEAHAFAARLEAFGERTLRRLIRQELDRDVGAKSNPIMDAERAVIEAATAQLYVCELWGRDSLKYRPACAETDKAAVALRAARSLATTKERDARDEADEPSPQGTAAKPTQPPTTVAARVGEGAGDLRSEPAPSLPTPRGALPTREDVARAIQNAARAAIGWKPLEDGARPILEDLIAADAALSLLSPHVTALESALAASRQEREDDLKTHMDLDEVARAEAKRAEAERDEARKRVAEVENDAQAYRTLCKEYGAQSGRLGEWIAAWKHGAQNAPRTVTEEDVKEAWKVSRPAEEGNAERFADDLNRRLRRAAPPPSADAAPRLAIDVEVCAHEIADRWEWDSLNVRNHEYEKALAILRKHFPAADAGTGTISVEELARELEKEHTASPIPDRDYDWLNVARRAKELLGGGNAVKLPADKPFDHDQPVTLRCYCEGYNDCLTEVRAALAGRGET